MRFCWNIFLSAVCHHQSYLSAEWGWDCFKRMRTSFYVPIYVAQKVHVNISYVVFPSSACKVKLITIKMSKSKFKSFSSIFTLTCIISLITLGLILVWSSAEPNSPFYFPIHTSDKTVNAAMSAMIRCTRAIK